MATTATNAPPQIKTTQTSPAKDSPNTSHDTCTSPDDPEPADKTTDQQRDPSDSVSIPHFDDLTTDEAGFKSSLTIRVKKDASGKRRLVYSIHCSGIRKYVQRELDVLSPAPSSVRSTE
ncbi:hypothetical protein Z517_09263 [Fonsecaea pedrosoi CBS 271.37]|uniref:Uncharacterized protein n=1 Tax=Fonsecaea pedrosoi CBS 271.37 TaxID=1442368 RepID=A0A0D2GWS8_9EURO|nr:uncharacterized protein Z517_09263 [Fonsecaea pedrosoi CBS 271.37]KIW76819.1 hypothetical protein Z517_09263 [Fonsecaea pedrosoi CBS 271.37]